MNMTENKEVKSFYTKMNKVRGDLLTLDWKDDKFLSLGGRSGYNYLSIDKIKRNLAPVLQAHGIDLGIEYCDLKQLGEPNTTNLHWLVTLRASLIDIDTGFERVYTAYGESSDHGDKGVNKAQTAAMKQFLSNTFMLIDGIDPDADVSERNTSFTPKTHAEILEAKSKILANAVRTKAPDAPAPVFKQTPVKEEKAPEEKETPKAAPKTVRKVPEKAPEEPVVTPEPEEPKEDLPPMPIEACDLAEPVPEMMPDKIIPLVAESVSDLKVTIPQRNAIANILKVRTKMALDGQISVMEYNTMSADYADIKDNASGAAFIGKYKVVGRSV